MPRLTRMLLVAGAIAFVLLGSGCVYYPAHPYRAHYAEVWVPGHWSGPRGDVWIEGHYR